MNVLIATDFLLYKLDNKYYLNETTFKTVERYKNEFGAVSICTRVKKIDKIDSNFFDASKIIDNVIPVSSLMECLIHKRDRFIYKGLLNVDLVIARVPSIIAYRVANIAMKQHVPVFSVVMGCAWDAYWNHSLIGKIIAPYMFFSLKHIVKQSKFVLYVTKFFLQKRYPTKAINVGISDVNITQNNPSILTARINKIVKSDLKKIKLVTIGNVDNRCKGMQFVIMAIPSMLKAGYEVDYTIIGGGNPKRLKTIARKYKVDNCVSFTGRINSEEIFRIIDESDIYVQPSLQEGLPRSVVEAMSRGCPCICAKTGGMPELIDPRYIIRRKDPNSIYEAVCRILNRDEMCYQAKSNFAKTGAFLEEILNNERQSFYKVIKQNVEVA